MREHQIQKQIADLLTWEIAPAGKLSPAGVLWFSVDHANYAGAAGARTGRGIVAGIPDMVVLYRGLAHFVELKPDSRSARLSDPQQRFATALLLNGSKFAAVRDATETLAALDAWQLPRNKRVRL